MTTAAEHRSVLDPIRRLARRGTEITIVGVDAFGRVSCDAIAQAMRPNTVLVSTIWANNEVGSLNPIRELSQLCRERGVLFHTDAVQAVGKLEIDLAEIPIDLLSASAHKLYGPKGVGMLFVRRGARTIPIEPLLDGGGHEQRLRSGTLPVPLIVGFGEACRIAAAEMSEDSKRLTQLRDKLWAGLRDAIDGVVLNGHPSERLPGNLNVSFEQIDGEALMTGLTGIAVSSGSACTSADPEPSHVLRHGAKRRSDPSQPAIRSWPNDDGCGNRRGNCRSCGDGLPTACYLADLRSNAKSRSRKSMCMRCLSCSRCSF